MRSFSLCLLLALAFAALTQPVAAAAPSLAITAPANNALIVASDVEVAFTASDFSIVPSIVPLAEYAKRPDANRPNEGHLHLTLDLSPLVVWDQNAPYTFRAVPPGEHQLTVELANNDHSSFTPPIIRTVRFTTVARNTPIPTAMPATGGTAPDYAAALVVGMFLMLAGLHTRRRLR